MENKNIYLFIGIAILVVMAGLGIIFISSNRVNDDSSGVSSTQENGEVAGTTTYQNDPGYVEAVAKYLTEKGMVMYGSAGCGHCQNQKELFGEAFQYIDYVECADPNDPNYNNDECIAKNIEGVPTWVYQEQKYSGEQSIEKLAQVVGFGQDNIPSNGDHGAVE